MSNLTPQQILAAARALVCKRAPYFQAGILGLVPREMPGYGSFATTKSWVMLWDPAIATKFGVEGTAAVLVHELSHLIRDHFARFSAPGINPNLGNIAGDLAINPSLIEMGFNPPEGSGVWPQMFKLPNGLTAEQYYAELLKMEAEYVYLDSATDEQLRSKAIKVEGCGSCSGRKRADEPEENEGKGKDKETQQSKGKDGAQEEAQGGNEGRTENEIQRIKTAVAKAIQEKGRGSAPSDLERWAAEQLAPPKVRWEEKLARACRSAIAYRPGAGRSTYTKISRRQAGLGFGAGAPVLPSYRATRPRVTFLVDTSGSMSSDDLASALTEAQGILRACGASLDVMVCDADVHGYKEVRSIDQARAMLHGGGGSDFMPAFQQLAEHVPKVEIVVAATDGDISVPKREPPGMQVIWLLIGRHAQLPCSWGTFIKVD
jgi:predicted metal-dependent peptidase